MNRLAFAAALVTATALAVYQAQAANPTTTPTTVPAATPGAVPACPGDKVVWVNSSTHVYHYQGDKYFGHTTHGRYLCEKAAITAHFRAEKAANP